MKKQDTKHEEIDSKKVEEWKGKYLRALADYQNLERRTATVIIEKEKNAAEQVIHDLLVVLDTFETAQKHLNDEGLKLGLEGFEAVLKHHGVKKIDVLHKKFDPNEMECLEVIEGDKDDEVVEEIRPGYIIGEKILRPALVKVGKKSDT